MTTPRPSPLSEEDFEIINNAMLAADALEENITRAELADIDVSADRERLAADRERLRKVKQAFFPGR